MRRVVALSIICACSHDSSRVITKPLASDGVHLRDADGRVALLRGINARVDGVFDVTLDGGRIPLESIPVLTQADCHRMRQLGFDLLRLPIQWSGIEPASGSYDDAYLARVDAAIACADAAGMLVVVDLHQDAYSKEIGEDGVRCGRSSLRRRSCCKVHMIARVSRIHVARVAGTPASIEASAIGDEIRVELESSIDAAHAVYIPERFAANASATCDGVALDLARDVATGIRPTYRSSPTRSRDHHVASAETPTLFVVVTGVIATGEDSFLSRVT